METIKIELVNRPRWPRRRFMGGLLLDEDLTGIGRDFDGTGLIIRGPIERSPSYALLCPLRANRWKHWSCLDLLGWGELRREELPVPGPHGGPRRSNCSAAKPPNLRGAVWGRGGEAARGRLQGDCVEKGLGALEMVNSVTAFNGVTAHFEPICSHAGIVRVYAAGTSYAARSP